VEVGTVVERLEDLSSATTLKTYAHLLPEMEDKGAGINQKPSDWRSGSSGSDHIPLRLTRHAARAGCYRKAPTASSGHRASEPAQTPPCGTMTRPARGERAS